MPSPFPGMDPYLEGELWTTVHSQLAAGIARQLAPKIAPRYIARTEKRFVVASPEDGEEAELVIYADVGVRHARRNGKAAPREIGAIEAPLVLVTVLDEKAPHYWVEIRDARKKTLVTAIEVQSPFNKRGLARDEYLKKRQALLASPAHLLEIDLLRRGQRVPMKKALPPAEYFIFLSRAHRRPMTEIWPITLAEPLPEVSVPLLGNDPDAHLDLQQAFAQLYDELRYDLEVDYRHPPDIPLNKTAARWADRLLRKSGHRT